MFGIVLGVALVLTVVACATARPVIQRARELGGGPIGHSGPAQRIAGAALALLLIAAGVLAATGFAAALRNGDLDGWALLIHTGAGPLAGLALLAQVLAGVRGPAARWSAPRRAWFWLTAALGFVTMASILACMPTWLGYADQACAYQVHRYASVAFVAALVVQLVTAWLERGAARAAGGR